MMANMEEKKENLDDIVARSNLVATAGEFIPKFHLKSENNQFATSITGHTFSFDNPMFFGGQDETLCQGYSSEFIGVSSGFGADNDCVQYTDMPTNIEDNTFSEMPHSSNWNLETNSNDCFGRESVDTRETAQNSFWANRGQSYSKYRNNKSSYSWKQADKKFEQNYPEEQGNRGENSQSRSDMNYYGSNEFHSVKYPNNFSFTTNKFKPNCDFYDKFPSNVRPSTKNGNTYNRNRGWASVPHSESRSCVEVDRFSISDSKKSKNRKGSKSNSGDSEEYSNMSFNLEELLNKKKSVTDSAKMGKKLKANEEIFEKDNLTKRSANSPKKKDDRDKNSKINQRERLVDLLTRGVLECLVCYEQVHQNASVWSCSNCYHVMHLRCIIKWARSSKSDFGWRCPACQNITRQVPYGYYCFCGKVRDPEWNRADCPHSCGEICGKTHKKTCPHKCILLCHPGPCPQCTATIIKPCGCQKTQKSVQCFNSDVVTCSTICGKTLNCKVHKCLQNCHMDECADCKEIIHQVCFCGKESRGVSCTKETLGVDKYSCGKICGLKLSCENHYCDSICHEGECKKCNLLPEVVNFCPCGKSEINSLTAIKRTKCTDPIPTCELICGKELICGQPENRHICENKCHEGFCPICPLETVVKCRCGHMDKMLPCSELLTGGGDARCAKRCTKRRSCGKHKCNQTCCIDIDHICPLPCNRMLQCSLHRCEETCHRGHCRPCWRASFEELYCECGAEVIYPPVPCGTRRPTCSKPCSRRHNCDHPPTHNCHSSNQCPPCTVLTKKYCHGRHELRKAVPCHQDAFSCGLPCNKGLSCGKHKCISACHEGLCLKEDQFCLQPCKVPRPICGHSCGAPCHEGPCPSDLPCKEMIRVTCECGHRYTTRVCHDNAKEYQRIATGQLATKIADVQAGQTVDLDDVILDSRKLSYKTLECNDECKLIERNRRLAIALEIKNPDLCPKLIPRYSEFMRHWAKKDARFCQMVHDKLTDLVQLAKQSKQKSRSFSFDPMNREKRQFVHQYCEHFGCKSVAYDPEPKRNVVATALKDQSWLPTMSLLEVIQRETWPRKVPAPVNVKMTAFAKTSQRTMEVLPIKTSKNQTAVNSESTSSTQSTSQIDYFDCQPTNS